MCGEPPAPSRRAGELSGVGKYRWFCLAYFAPNRCRDQPRKRAVVQSHGITLSFLTPRSILRRRQAPIRLIAALPSLSSRGTKTNAACVAEMDLRPQRRAILVLR